MKPLFAVCAGLTLCTLAPGARAADSPVPPAPQAREPSAQQGQRWYGWQTLTSDLASVGLLMGGFQAADGYGLFDGGTPPMANVMATLGAAGYLAGAPTLHFIHDRPARALGSFGLRVSLPILGGALGSGLATCPPPRGDYGNCGLAELIVGVSAGALAAIVLDGSLLAWEPARAASPATARLGFAPLLSSDGKRGELRVFGNF